MSTEILFTRLTETKTIVQKNLLGLPSKCDLLFLLLGFTLDSHLQSLTNPFHRPTAKSVQGFQRVSQEQNSNNHVGRPLMHLSAPLQASGEARYTDDIPRQEGELYAGLVMSTHAHAKISTDWSCALDVDGVEGYVAVEDVPGSNMTGLFNDEKVFADGEVTHFGQIIGMVLGQNQIIAQRAAKLVKVSYTDMPSIITIEVRFPPLYCGNY